jgi:hypothetical protein
MNLGSLVQNLIRTNIAIWHKDTLVRNGANIPLAEKARLFLSARILNSDRNDLRDIIDVSLGQKSYSKKVNYYGGRHES